METKHTAGLRAHQISACNFPTLHQSGALDLSELFRHLQVPSGHWYSLNYERAYNEIVPIRLLLQVVTPNQWAKIKASD